MKTIFNPIVKAFVGTRLGWAISKMLLRFTEWLRFEKSKIEATAAEKKLQVLFNDLTVKEGYFKGLKYPGYSSFGSSLFPKLAGSYESELFPFFKGIENNPYDSIIDIGCAEGFYAAGLALKFPSSKIYAFDIDEAARKFCTELCAINGVAGRVEVLGECTAQLLGSMNSGFRNLVICDCEGFEKDLFVLENVSNLYNCDLIIELHPMFNSDIKNYLCRLFGTTHQLQIISSKDDARKIFELGDMYQNFSYIDKLKLVQEGRMFTMDWLVAISKKSYI